jgi:hypothetical protein
VEERICHEDQEVLNDILYDRKNIETYGIISDVSVVLNFYEDQHVSVECYDVKEKVYTLVDISPDYEAEINDKLVKKTREDSSLFFPRFSELKENLFVSLMKKMKRIVLYLKQMSLETLLMMKKLFQMLTKNN